jgi:hypothetical protein
MTITLDVPPELEGQLRQAARRQGVDLAAFLLDSARQRLRPDILPEPEATLLQVINAPVAPEARSERDALLAEQDRRDLTIEEQETLTRRIDEVELANAERWRCIAELARRRGLSLSEIAGELEIPLP